MDKRFLLGLALLLPCAAGAQGLPTAQQLSGSRALAMGEAYRAIASSNDALYYNLAGLAQTPRYEIDLQYAFDGGVGLDVYNGSIVDGKTSEAAAGLAYSRVTADGLSGSVVHFAMGLPMGPMASFGIGLKYLGFSRPEDTNAITMDAGLLLRPFSRLSFGAAVYNAIDVSSREAPRQAGVGVAWGDDSSYRLSADVAFDFVDETDPSYHAGGELFVGRAFPIRAGFKHVEATGESYASAGLGIVTSELGLEGAFVQNVDRGDDRLFSFTLKIFL